MKVVRCCFVGVLALGVWGCGTIRAGVGLEEYTDTDGTVKVRVTGPAPVDTAAGLLSVLGPWGIAAAAAVKLGTRFIRHKEVIAHGQKDDDFDGVPDDQQQPPVTPA